MAYSKEQLVLIRELRSDICVCKNPKEINTAFCRVCFYKLPRAIRTVLYQRVGNGYENARTEALRVLGFAKTGENKMSEVGQDVK